MIIAAKMFHSEARIFGRSDQILDFLLTGHKVGTTRSIYLSWIKKYIFHLHIWQSWQMTADNKILYDGDVGLCGHRFCHWSVIDADDAIKSTLLFTVYNLYSSYIYCCIPNCDLHFNTLNISSCLYLFTIFFNLPRI